MQTKVLHTGYKWMIKSLKKQIVHVLRPQKKMIIMIISSILCVRQNKFNLTTITVRLTT